MIENIFFCVFFASVDVWYPSTIRCSRSLLTPLRHMPIVLITFISSFPHSIYFVSIVFPLSSKFFVRYSSCKHQPPSGVGPKLREMLKFSSFFTKGRSQDHTDVKLVDALLENPILTDGVAASTYLNTLSSLRSSMKNQGAEGFRTSESQRRSHAPDGEPAGNVGAQAEVPMKPSNLFPWNSFDEEVGLESRVESPTLQLLVNPTSFRPRQIYTTRSLERTSANLFMTTFGTPFTDYYSYQFRNSDDPRQSLSCSQEYDLTSFRTDALWTMVIQQSSPPGLTDIFGCSTSLDEYPLLPHEHKNPRTFPFLAEQFQELNAFFDDKNNVNEDEDDNRKPSKDPEAEIEFLQKKWIKDVSYDRTKLKMPYENLIAYWNRAGEDTRPGMTNKYRYPIIQIYIYMIRKMTKYGVLSTLDHTWFLKLDENNNLHISRCFKFDGVGTKNSMRYAYACLIETVLDNGCRLQLSKDMLIKAGEIPSQRKMLQSWLDVYNELAQSHGLDSLDSNTSGSKSKKGGSGRNGNTRKGGNEDCEDGVSDTLDGSNSKETEVGSQRGFRRSTDHFQKLREMLPFPQDQFEYYGGVHDTLYQSSHGQFGGMMRVTTNGVDTVVKVLDPQKNVKGEYLSKEEAEAKSAALGLQVFRNEMDVYEVLRPIWGTFVPFYLYGGYHLFNDFIIALTFEGRCLDDLSMKEITVETMNKARAALDAVHSLNVAHRDIALRNFVLNHVGEVRIIDFGMAKINASKDEMNKDVRSFKREFLFLDRTATSGI